MPPDFAPGLLFEVLLRHRVRFVLIGGLAALAHGTPFPTEDVDITPEASADNLTRLSDALTEVDARVRTEGVDDGLPFAHDTMSLSGASVWNLSTTHGDLDLSLVPGGTAGYGDLVRDAADTEAYGLVISIASLADVVRSKQAANRPKDQRALPVLREILAARFGDRPGR